MPRFDHVPTLPPSFTGVLNLHSERKRGGIGEGEGEVTLYY